MKTEALKRMRKLGLSPDVIERFRDKNLIVKSEGNGEVSSLSEKEEKMVREWEEETGHLVFYVMHNDSDYGEMLSLLYVSKYEEDWDVENGLIENGGAFAYVMNLDYEVSSEFGSVYFENVNGVLNRLGV